MKMRGPQVRNTKREKRIKSKLKRCVREHPAIDAQSVLGTIIFRNDNLVLYQLLSIPDDVCMNLACIWISQFSFSPIISLYQERQRGEDEKKIATEPFAK